MHLKWDTQTLQSYVSEEFPLHQLGDHHDNFIYFEHGDWKVIWDPFYENYYFFNVQTLESTWFPPLGLENFAFDCINLSRKETHEGASEKNAGSKHSCGSISVVTDALLENRDSFHCTDEENKLKDLDEQKGKQQGDRLAYDGHDRRVLTINENGNAFSIPKIYTTSSIVLDAAHENVAISKIVRKSHSVQAGCPSNSLLKYWHQRYSLFSRFDNGIKMDEESWFSVTPEQIAMHHAFRCGAGTIIDCFTGVGGNAIQFAMRSNHVIAIDLDPQKIEYAQQNAFIYGVSGRIDFIKGDFFKIARSFKGDIAFLSPPWGGPDYAKMKTYDINSLKPREGQYLFKIASMIADKVVMFLPRNVDVEQLVGISLSVDPPWNLEVEKNYLNGKLKSITAYFDRTMS